MFSQGQLIFGLCFFIAFVIVMIFAYRKDLALHKIFYKGNYKGTKAAGAEATTATGSRVNAGKENPTTTSV